MIQFLTRWRRRLVHVHYYYPNPVDRQRARLLMYFLWLLFLLSIIATFTLVLPLIFRQRSMESLSELGSVVILLMSPLLMLAIQRGYLRPASWLLILALLLLSAPASLDGSSDIRGIVLMVPLVVAGTLLRWQGILITLVMSAAAVVMGSATIVTSSELLLDNPDLLNTVIMLGTLILCGIFLLIFSTRLTLLPPRFTEELQQLKMIAGLDLFARENDTETAFANRVVDVLSDLGGYAFARILLLDAAGTKVEQVCTGSGMIPSAHPPESETSSVIREVIYTRQTLIIDIAQHATRREHLLTGSAAGLLIPLIHGSQFVGILDVQTLRAGGFSMGEQTTLEMLGQQFTSGLLQLRLILSQQNDNREQQMIIQRQRDRLQQLERAAQQAVLNAWSAYLEQRGQHIFGYDVDEETLTPHPASDLPLALQQTLARGETVIEQVGDQQIIGVPISLRGQVVGGISFALPSNRPVTHRQKEMITSVVQRLALALDNKRLFEQSQSQAQRESKANEIARMLLSSTDVKAVLQLAATTFNEALGAVQTRIHFNPAIQSQTEDAS